MERDRGQEKTQTERYCVIPAAGRSSRMGEWKPLLPWPGPGGTVIGAAVANALAAGLRPVVVTGYRADELSAALSSLGGVEIVRNPDWEQGMLGSVVTGLSRARFLASAVGGTATGCLIAHADMPLVPGGAYVAVLRREAVRAVSGMGPATIFPSYPLAGGLLGHPVWIPFSAIDDLASLGPGERLRDYLLSGPWEAIDVDDEGILVDLDTPDAYAERYEQARRRSLTEYSSSE